MKIKVYKILPSVGYQGLGLVAAESVEAANHYIEIFQKHDKYNFGNSKGFMTVCEFDCISELYSEKTGIILNAIFSATGI